MSRPYTFGAAEADVDSAGPGDDSGGVVASSGGIINNLVDTTTQVTQDSIDKVVSAKKAVADLFDTQAQVDAALAAMPDGPDKDRLTAQRTAARGYFNDYVLSPWQKFSQALGISSATDTIPGLDDSGVGSMGVIPMVIWGGLAVAAMIAAALLTYAVTARDKELAIINDPAIRKYSLQVAQATGSSGGLSDVSSLVKWAVIGGVAFYAFKIYQGLQKS